ncbi:DMT family transporter [Diaphorobacter aerolatus]|uniref:EamA family transporter n=1 Tax=Diaphorobacter aerolatus TaxID=1288495 RepID=A0A7H0GFT7_9BURK|nr:EamA family transporter [Diaphorobacter aerolatus]QNP47153.1 EamA family transporter [Diaphorobacter aerolatus]
MANTKIHTISPALGITLVSIAAVFWGTTGTAQSLGGGSLSPYWLGAAQLVVSAGFYAALCWVLAQRGPLRSRRPLLPTPSQLGMDLRHVALAAVGIGGYSICFYAGVKLTGVAVGTAVAIGSSPIWAGLMQAIFLRTPLSALWWCGTAVSIAGGVAMALSKGSGAASSLSVPGLLLCLLAGLSYAAYALINKRLVARASPALVNFYVFSGAALFAVPVAFALAGVPRFTASSLLVALYLGVVVSGVAHALFSSGLRGISGPTGVTLSLIEPVAAFVLAIWVVGEHQALQSWVGLALVMVGLLVVVRAELQASRRERLQAAVP